MVYTRQGNPAWAGQYRDGQTDLIRSDDLFFGAKAGDVQPDWVDLSKVQIPQADEQQRLLANLIEQMSRDAMPLPRFWYLPNGDKAAVVMTGDDHGSTGGTAGQFDWFKSQDPAGCSVVDWTCVRSTSYVYTSGSLTDAQAASYEAQGFEVGAHVTTNCADWTPATLEGFFATQLSDFATKYTSLPAPSTNRTHCIAWSDWATQPKVELSHGIRLDANYYYWPDAWVQDRPGMFTGSGMPMRFADIDGSLIDVYQAATQITDESGMTIPTHIATLLDNALGSKGYFGVFTMNMHTDSANHPGAQAIVQAAQARGVPVVSARQMLTWLDGRNASSFGGLAFSGGVLSFSVAVGSGANGLQAMLPTSAQLGPLQSMTRNGSPVTHTTQTIKGVEYAVFSAAAGNYQATYGADTTAPAITAVSAAPHADGTATITWTTDESSDAQVAYGTSARSLSLNAGSSSLVTSHSVTLTGLTSNTTYYFRVSSADGSANTATSPQSPAPPASFTTPSAVLGDTTVADFSAGSPTNTYVSQTADGEVILAPAVGTEFSGASLPSGWSTSPWTTGGTSIVGAGALTDDGALAATDTYYGSGRSLEFVATFGADTFQHVGFGQLLQSVAGESWAMFSTFNTSSSLFARTNNNGTTTDTLLPGSWIGSPHRFRIDWTASSAVFSIDGTVVHTESVSIGATMRPIVSDYTNAGPVVTVDWLRMTPYATPGTFTSRVFDAGGTATWRNLDYTSAAPAGTSLSLEVRTGDTPTPDGTWSAFAPVANGADIPGVSRYLQYRAMLTSSDSNATPELQSVGIGYSVNAPPTITSANSITFTVGSAGSFTVTTSGSPTAAITESGALPSGVTLTDNGNGTATLAGTTASGGTYPITLSATNGVLPNASQSFTLTVIGNSAGYWLVAADGGIFTFGTAGFFGSTGGQTLDQPVVGMAPTPTGQGYWLVAADGGIFTFGDAGFFGSKGGQGLSNVVGMAPTPTGQGYWLVAADGGIFTFGDAGFFGSKGGQGLSNVVGMAATPSGNGYWLVASDGGIFAFGDAGFFGSMGGQPLDKPVVGMAATPSGNGYWLVASDGGIFAFGDAGFFGSMGGQPLDKPVVGMTATGSGNGYWLVASDGGIFTFGDAGFFGSEGGQPLFEPVVGMGGR